MAVALMSTQMVFAQTLSQKLDKSVKDLLDSPSGNSANLSLYVADAQGNLVYEYNPFRNYRVT